MKPKSPNLQPNFTATKKESKSQYPNPLQDIIALNFSPQKANQILARLKAIH